MARSNTGSTANYLSASGAPVTALPVTMACWFNPTVLTANFNLINLGNATGGNGDYLALTFDGANGYGLGDNRVVVDATTTSTPVASTTSVSAANTWHHACGVFASTTSRSAYLDGGGKGTNTTAQPNPTTWTKVDLGIYNAGGSFGPLNGAIAEVGIWNVALDDAEVAALAAGASPRLVRPTALKAYWPLIGRDAFDIKDLGNSGAYPQAVTGTMAAADHCRVFYPVGFELGFTGSAGGGTNYPQSLTGTLTAAGTLAKQASRSWSAGVTLAGSALKGVSRALAGGLTAAGSLAKKPARALAGTLTGTGAPVTRAPNKAFTGALASSGSLGSRAVARALSGGLTLGGSLAKRAARTVTGTLASAGALAKGVTIPLTGGLTLSGGAVSALKVFTRAFSATVTLAGSLTRRPGKALAGTLTGAGALTHRAVSRPLSAVLTLAGSVTKSVPRVFTGAVTPAGTLHKAPGKALAGGLTLAGTFARLPVKALAGTLTLAGLRQTAVSRSLTAAIALTGSLTKGIARALAGGALTLVSGALSTIRNVPKAQLVVTPLTFLGDAWARRTYAPGNPGALTFSPRPPQPLTFHV